MKLVVIFLLTLVCTVFCHRDRHNEIYRRRKINTDVSPRFLPEVAALGASGLLAHSLFQPFLPKILPFFGKIGEFLSNIDFLSIFKAFSPLRIIEFFQNIIQNIKKMIEGLKIVFAASITIDKETKTFEKTLLQPNSIYHNLGENGRTRTDDSYDMRKRSFDNYDMMDTPIKNEDDRQNRIVAYLRKAEEFLERLKQNFGMSDESNREKRSMPLDDSFKAMLPTALNRLFMKGLN